MDKQVKKTNVEDVKSEMQTQNPVNKTEVENYKNDNGIDVLDLALKTDDVKKEYKIILNNKFIQIDESINKRLMDAGFSNEQAQLVYNLAGEVLIPKIKEIMEEFRAYKELSKLESYFGGEEKFDEISRQISLWAEKNLPTEIYSSLNSSFYGVIALYNMMTNGDPKVMIIYLINLRRSLMIKN